MKKILISISLLVIGYLIGYYTHSPTQIIYKQIEKDKKIRDSLNIVNDTITSKIEHITKRYYEKRDSILNNDSATDMVFFTNYINSYQRATKDSQFNIH